MADQQVPNIPDPDLDARKELLRNLTTSRSDAISQINWGNSQAAGSGRDPFKQAKVGTFNAGPEGHQFDRYYNHPAYSRLGFNPWIDMEQHYNENSSKWEDFIRTRSQWNNLFGLAWDSLVGGKSNVQEALDYEKYSRIGSTSRGGAFGTINNAYLNSGYTIGLMSEILVEEIGLAAATVLTEGGAGGAAALRTGVNAGRLTRAFAKGYDFSKNIGKGFKNLTKLNKLQDIKVARGAWNAIKKGGNAFNPLYSTSRFMKSLRAGELTKLDMLAVANRGFGAFYRDIREINLALNESGLEAGFVVNTTKRELFDEYVEKHGKVPEGEELEKIQKLAEDAADSAYINNAWLIYATNRLAYNSFFRKYAPKVGQSTLWKNAYGKVVRNKNFMKSGAPALQWVKKGLWHEAKHAFSKTTLKQAPINTLKFLGKYTKMNFAEGAQEYFQEVIQDAEVQRAKDDYYQALKGGYYDYYGRSMDKFVSPEGFEVFMSGFLMGGMVGPHMHAAYGTLDLLKAGGQRVFQPGKYKEQKAYKAERQKYWEEQVEKINKMTNTPWKYHNMTSLGALQDQVEGDQGAKRAQENENQKDFYDVEDLQTGKAILRALQMGSYDVLIDQLEQMDKMSEQELKEAFGDNIDKDGESAITDYKKNARKIIQRAREIKEFYDDTNNRFKNPYNYAESGDVKEQAVEQQQLYNSFEAAKAMIVLNQYSFLRTQQRMDSVLDDFVNKGPFWKKNKIRTSDMSILLDQKMLAQELDLLRGEVESLTGEGATDAQVAEAKQKQERLKKLQRFDLLLTKYRGTQELASRQEKLFEKEKAQVEAAVGGTVSWKTGRGGRGEIIEDLGDKWKIRREDGRVVRINKANADTGAQAEIDFREMVTPFVDELRKEFDAYMNHLAEETGTHIKPQELDSSFQKFLDFYSLDQDGKNLSNLVNKLMDPEQFRRLAERQNEIYKYQWEQRLPEIRESLKKFYDQAENNELLNQLAKKYNAFILEDDLELLFDEENPVIPSEFYDITKLQPIKIKSERHKNIVAEIKEFLEKTGRVEPEVTEEGEAADTDTGEQANVETEESRAETERAQIPSIAEIIEKDKTREVLGIPHGFKSPQGYFEIDIYFIYNKEGTEVTGIDVGVSTYDPSIKGYRRHKGLSQEFSTPEDADAWVQKVLAKDKPIEGVRVSEEPVAINLATPVSEWPAELVAKGEEVLARVNASNAKKGIAAITLQDLVDSKHDDIALAISEYNEGLTPEMAPEDVVTTPEEAPAEEPEIKVATDVNPEARRQLNVMGYSNTQIDALTREEREVILKQGIPSEEWFDTGVVAEEPLVEEPVTEEVPTTPVGQPYWKPTSDDVGEATQQVLDKIEENQERVVDKEDEHGRLVDGQDTVTSTQIIGENFDVAEGHKVRLKADQREGVVVELRLDEDSNVENDEFVVAIDDSEEQVTVKYGEFDNITYGDSTIAGTTLDNIVRDFFTGAIEDIDTVDTPAGMTDEAFDAMREILKQLKTDFEAKGLTVLANNINVFDLKARVGPASGELDLLAYNENGEFFIIDVKSSYKKFWSQEPGTETRFNAMTQQEETVTTGGVLAEGFTKRYPSRRLGAARSKRGGYELQQSIYKNLFEKQYGVPIQQISLAPFVLEYDENGHITSVTKQKDITLNYRPEVEQWVEKVEVEPIGEVTGAPTQYIAPEALEGLEDVDVEIPTVEVKFDPRNQEQILLNRKKTTVRTATAANQLKLGKQFSRAYFYVTDKAGNRHRFMIINTGQKNVEEAGGAEAMAISEALPTEATGNNTNPVTIGETTYYTMFKGTASWLQGKGKLNVFSIIPVPEVEVVEEEVQTVETLYKKYRDKVQAAQNLEELKQVEEDVNAEITEMIILNQAVVIGTETISEMIQQRIEELKTGLQVDNIQMGEVLVLKGKFANFGTVKVTDKGTTSKGLKYIKVKSLTEEGLTGQIWENQLPKAVAQKGEQAIKDLETSQTAKDRAKENVENSEINQEEINEAFKEADDMSSKDAEDNMLGNIKPKC